MVFLERIDGVCGCIRMGGAVSGVEREMCTHRRGGYTESGEKYEDGIEKMKVLDARGSMQ